MYMKAIKGFLILMAVACAVQGAAGAELTQVIYRPTGYVLPASAWEVKGFFNFLPLSLPSIGLDYGLTSGLQVGTGLAGDLSGIPNAGAKLSFGYLGPLAVALSAWSSFDLADESFYLGMGLASSLKAGGFELHAGSSVYLLPSLSFFPYLAFDYWYTPNITLLGEADFMPFYMRLGALIRALAGLNLRVWAGFPALSLGGSIAVQF